VAYLPRYAPYSARVAGLLNLRNRVPALAALSERIAGLSAKRRLPEWHRQPYREDGLHLPSMLLSPPPQPGEEKRVILLVDTFNRWFEPENARAAERVLQRAGYTVCAPQPAGARPLCCGRTFLAAGLVEEARSEARRMVAALAPAVEAGIPIVGLEPSCLLTLRDEFTVLLPGAETAALAKGAMLFEEFIAAESAAGRFAPELRAPAPAALIHGHCHQKAFGTLAAVERMLRLVPGLSVSTFDSTCCGMAGAFGYEAEHYEMSLKIGELAVLPTVRAAPPETLIVAAGTSCRHQIADAAGRTALHPARVLDYAMAGPTPPPSGRTE